MAKKNKNLSSAIESRRKKRNQTIPVAKKNPFEVRMSRLKHNIIGKKIKTDKGLPGVARSKADQKRKKTLLKEYKQRFKTNVIIDRRFGEFDNSISAEEKMLRRFTLEKQRHHEKSGMYNLDDNDEELTHYGQSLADINNFDDAGLKLTDDEDEDDTENHFGGFLKRKSSSKEIDEENFKESQKKMSKQEIMDQVVANSKKKKYERQQTQEHAFELTQQLDSQWKEIQSLLVKRDDMKQTSKGQKQDDYDRTVRELFFEGKAKATDKLKTEEQIAREEKDRLEKLEKERQQRMSGITDDDEESLHQSADAIIERKSKKQDNRQEVCYSNGKMVVPEVLDGLFNFQNTTEDKESDNDQGSDDENDTDSDDQEDDDDESEHEDLFSDDENDKNKDDVIVKDDDDNDDGDEEMDGKDSEKHKKQKKQKKMMTSTDTKKAKKSPSSSELPFVYKAPVDFEEFLSVIKHRKEKEIVTIIQRIRKCHHVKLDQKNQKKIETLLSILLDYIDYLCGQSYPPLMFINELSGEIYELVGDVTLYASKAFQKKLKDLFQTTMLRFKIKGNCGMFPTLKELVFLKVIALTFPTSDLNHVITTPSLFLMAMILSKAHFMNMKDVISGIFLLDIVYDYVKLAKRYIPEVLCFLTKLLYQATPRKTQIKKVSASILNVRKSEQSMLVLQRKMKSEPAAINISNCLSSSCDTCTLMKDSVRLSCIKNTLALCKKFALLYQDLDTFHEVFQPCACILESLPVEKYPRSVKDLNEQTLALMKSKSSTKKIPLTLQKRKPIPLPLLEPQFDESYEVRTKRRAGDKTQNEHEKLKYKLKKETKGAMREIRKDAHFLAKEQLKETLNRDATRKQKVKELQKDLENERREIKEMEKASKKGL